MGGRIAARGSPQPWNPTCFYCWELMSLKQQVLGRDWKSWELVLFMVLILAPHYALVDSSTGWGSNSLSVYHVRTVMRECLQNREPGS